jgi:DNA polymerase III epsilon subunit-like protein
MVSFGAVVVEPGLNQTFYGECRPISEEWVAEALAVSGFTREQTMTFKDPMQTMKRFGEWLDALGRPIFASDNVAFDWQFINYYMHKFTGSNPFGFSGRRIGDLYCGMQKNMFTKWKHLRQTKHDHNPVNDAKGNAEALLKMGAMGLKGVVP